jgi:hypothetical protein
MFFSVTITRRVQITVAAARTPATRTLTNKNASNPQGPNNAPTAPINFQSPAPNPRTSTNGSSSASASPAPSKLVNVPRHPPNKACAPTPTANPETVNQFGIFRLRQSTHPANIVIVRVNVQITKAEFTAGCVFIKFICEMFPVAFQFAYVGELNFVTESENAVKSRVATSLNVATEAKASNAATSAYSTRSCPVSSRHNRLRMFRIFVFYLHQSHGRDFFGFVRSGAHVKNSCVMCPEST